MRRLLRNLRSLRDLLHRRYVRVRLHRVQRGVLRIGRSRLPWVLLARLFGSRVRERRLRRLLRLLRSLRDLLRRRIVRVSLHGVRSVVLCVRPGLLQRCVLHAELLRARVRERRLRRLLRHLSGLLLVQRWELRVRFHGVRCKLLRVERIRLQSWVLLAELLGTRVRE